MRALTTTDVAHRPLPGTAAPTSVGHAPDGSVVTFLLPEPGSLEQHLVSVDTATGQRRTLPTPGLPVEEEGLPLEEQLRRERSRELGTGVTAYAWARHADRLLVPMGDGLWVSDDRGASFRRVVEATPATGPLLDPKLSPDGSLVGFVSNDEVHVVPFGGGMPMVVTEGAAEAGRTHGLAEFIAQEEMGRSSGFWFSHDARHVAFCEVDENHVPDYRIVHQGSDDVGPGTEERHRYPFAGADNARVRVGVVPADGSAPGRPVWLDLGCTGIGEDRYVARVAWAPDGTVLVQVQDRPQRRLDLVRFDPTDGSGTLLISETSDLWINLHDHLRCLPDGRFLWSSERTGHRHVELRDHDGHLVTTLTSGDWDVTDVVAVGDDHAYVTGTRDSPLERHLYRVPFDPVTGPAGGIERLTDGQGVHAVTVHPDGDWFLETWSTPGQPPLTSLRSLTDGALLHRLHDAAADPAVAELALEPPEERTVTAADGTTLHVAVYRPAGTGPFPTVISVYGGPHAQLVTRSWGMTVALRAQFLRQQGFLVAVVDGRGSANRGLVFEAALHHRMGTVEVDDQVALVDALVTDGLTDRDRVGIYGWSYGGYLSGLCLARRPDVFLAACAGAPVTSWDGYDTHYTERYMGTPAENPDGYRQGSVVTHVDGVRDRHLLLVHGLIDENVHFRHTARLLNALVAGQIDHELLVFPDERHVPRREADRTYMEERLVRFFRKALAHL